MITSAEHKARLMELGKNLGVEHLANYVVNYKGFDLWAGACNKDKHHCRKGGLIEHTREVVDLCIQTNRYFIGTPKYMDEQKLYLAALFHDVGKLWDYRPVEGTDYAEWEAAPHKRNIHHISRSALVWWEACDDYRVSQQKFVNEEYMDEVLHAILSHHGLREWGSPVSPNTGIAWLLHLCDGISARMDDFNRQKGVPPFLKTSSPYTQA